MAYGLLKATSKYLKVKKLDESGSICEVFYKTSLINYVLQTRVSMGADQ